ncbi:hypothetical protein Gogos_007548 [Gossypium gossypioides]|uniref:Uncharacterized protein n=1 Tax=Gossypium gossypioides TaxID=34282 RepID=A0A7J9C8W9_GOSGO|nr:hypothetical protein [Gossypium gossypioides]
MHAFTSALILPMPLPSTILISSINWVFKLLSTFHQFLHQVSSALSQMGFTMTKKSGFDQYLLIPRKKKPFRINMNSLWNEWEDLPFIPRGKVTLR